MSFEIRWKISGPYTGTLTMEDWILRDMEDVGQLRDALIDIMADDLYENCFIEPSEEDIQAVWKKVKGNG